MPSYNHSTSSACRKRNTDSIVRDTGDRVPDDDDGVAMMVIMKSTDSYAQLQPLHQQRLSEEKHRQYR